MGLLDVLNGMQNGPRGPSAPSSEQSSGGMSPMTMALLGLLAWKAFKHLTASEPGAAPQPQQRSPLPPPTQANAGGGAIPASPAGSGGLSDLLKGGLGGLLAGGAAGSVLSGGLGGLLKQFEDNGQAQVAKSWVGTGPNQDISESDLAKSIGTNDINALAQHTGLSRDELLAGLRRELPGAIDELTPNGRVPSPQELSQRV
jgi:uncharacterized protein YidB (DUF937 family)